MSTAIIVGTISALLSSIVNFVWGKFCLCVGNYVNKSSIVIAYNEPKLVASLTSNDTMLVNLDQEVNNALDVDEKDFKNVGNLVSSRVVYTKSKPIMSELFDVIQNSSKQIKKFIFISKDYNLLKYANCGKTTYTLPSENYYRELKQTVGWDDESYIKIKEHLQTRKGDKIIVYNSFAELQKLLCDTYDFKIKC